MSTSEDATIQSLRSDIALRITTALRQSAATQIVVARRLGIPQSTLSKIMNGRIHDLSIELLLRVACRAGLALTLQTGRGGAEAGAFLSSPTRERSRPVTSALAMASRKSLIAAESRLSAAERLEAFLQHNQLVNEFHQAAQAVERKRLVGQGTPRKGRK